jgi:hypothetical protein
MATNMTEVYLTTIEQMLPSRFNLPTEETWQDSKLLTSMVTSMALRKAMALIKDHTTLNLNTVTDLTCS